MDEQLLAPPTNTLSRFRRLLFATVALSAIGLSVTYYNDQKFQSLVADYIFLAELKIRRASVSISDSVKIRADSRRTVEQKVKVKPPPKGATYAKKLPPKEAPMAPSEPLKLVWLLAYPFAGSRVALRIIQDYSGYSMATNYGDIIDTNRGFVTQFYNSEPVLPDSPNGPFKYRIDKPLPPSGYVLTKTHCSGFCIDINGDEDCIFKDYIDPLTILRRFFIACASGTKYTERGGLDDLVSYNPWRTKKVMLLVRDPLEIILSRFINMLEGAPKTYPMNARGLKEWCTMLDEQHGAVQLQNYFTDAAKAVTATQDVTCKAELFKITRYYNQATKLVGFLEEDVHVVYFEDYDTDLGSQITKMMDFLEYRTQESSQRRSPFTRVGEDNYPYYDMDQMDAMVAFIKAEATAGTKSLFERYL